MLLVPSARETLAFNLLLLNRVLYTPYACISKCLRECRNKVKVVYALAKAAGPAGNGTRSATSSDRIASDVPPVASRVLDTAFDWPGVQTTPVMLLACADLLRVDHALEQRRNQLSMERLSRQPVLEIVTPYHLRCPTITLPPMTLMRSC